MNTMGATAVCTILLLCTVATSTGGFYYQSAYQEPFPLPLQLQAFAPQPQVYAVVPYPYVSAPAPAAPVFSIYSQAQLPQARALLGYSYQMQDLAGGRGQVLYVAGPNSQEVFLQNAGAFQIFSPKLNISNSKTDLHNKNYDNSLMDSTLNYFKAEVLPHGRALLGAAPLFTYSVNVSPTPKTAERDNEDNTPKSTTDQSKDNKHEEEAEESLTDTTESIKSDSDVEAESPASDTSTSPDPSEKQPDENSTESTGDSQETSTNED